MHSTQEMFTLINDVNSYPLFLPDCGDSKIVKQNDLSMTASILVSKGGLNKWFTTENELVPNEKIMLSLVDGPFKYLKGAWRFSALSEEACKIVFELDYEFSNKLLSLAFGRVFTHLTNNIVQAFIERANKVYVKHV